MKYSNLKNKFKRNIIKLIFCGQKIFKADDMWFYNGRPTTVKNSMIAENKNWILKLQLYKHPLKHNDINDEAEILMRLKEKGAQCQPIIKTQGVDFFKRPYIVMEKIKHQEGIELADVLLAILEQHTFGIFHRDTKTDNVAFNGLIAKLLDYDQSQIIEELSNLNSKDSILFFLKNLSHFWQEENKLLNIGLGIDEATKNCMASFIGDSFDFSKTSLWRSFKPMPFYMVDKNKIKSKGLINIDIWRNALEKIELKTGEKILDINCDTGELSRFLHTKGCNITAYSSSANEVYATKIISNILGYNIKTINKLGSQLSEFDTIFLLNNKNEIKAEELTGAKRIIYRLENQVTENIPKGYIKTGDVELDKDSRLITYELK